MSPTLQFCAVIPVYNHERTITRVVEYLQTVGLSVFLVDDGCNAACAEELDRLSVLPDLPTRAATKNPRQREEQI